MAFWDELQQASWNGVPFGVKGGEVRFGRRTAVHEYPLTEEYPVWVEDLGRAARRITMSGFLIENSLVYGGGSVIAQRKAMIAACEQAGPGQLVHPTLGAMTVSLMEPAVAGEQWDNGRVFEIKFVFIESGKRIYPTQATSTEDATDSAADAADGAASADFSTAASPALANGATVVNQAIAMAGSVSSQVVGLAADATSAIHLVAELSATLSPSLIGSLGRYAAGALSGFTTGNILVGQGTVNPTATVQTLVALGVAARAAVSVSALALESVASMLGAGASQPANFATSTQTLVASLLAATVDPADGVRVLADLASLPSIQPDVVAVAWAPAAAMQSAANDLFRRAAVVSLARASSTYQPSSSNDALTIRTLVIGLLGAEIEIAGDKGQDATFNALRSLSAAVVADLTTRGAALPSIKQFKSSTSLPAPVIAQMLYRDPSRASELVTEANPPHPAFMPMSFSVLSS